MKYRLIIQDLKASPDHNVKAFVREVENMKWLKTNERYYYLNNRHKPGVIKILVNDTIPYILRVAYAHRDKTRRLSILDLVNEGIIGAHTALEKCDFQGKRMMGVLRSYINNHINRMLVNNGCENEEDFFSHEESLDEDVIGEDEEDIISEVDCEKKRALLYNLLQSYKHQKCERDANIITDYFLNRDTDYKALCKKYNVSRERIRQIIARYTRYCKAVNMWAILSADFNLPVNEVSYYYRQTF